MKYILTAFIIICSIGITYFFLEHRKNQIILSPDIKADPHYVSIKDNQFMLEDTMFYPKVINFVVSLRMNDTVMWPAIFVGYSPNSVYHYESRDSSIADLRAHFNLVRDMGFNTLRIVGIGEPEIRDKYTGRINFKAMYGNNYNYCLYLQSDEDYRKYFKAIDDLLQLVKEAGLKAIFTTKLFHEAPETEKHLARLTERFKENTSIMAYDFFNEPLYFDSLARKKEEVYYITRHWQNIVKKHAPHHLTTIGLACQREVYEWDPNLMNVDFISFHPYEYEPDQVRNELYWYYRYVKKPWIIGETGIPSNNDSIPYENQVKFAEKTLLQNLNCGGMGYSWWQYKDVDWGSYHQNFLGVVNRNGETKTSKGETVHGTPKPVTKTIGEFDVSQKRGPCECPDNYYNFSSNNAFRLSGRLVDEDGKPIDGGGILAWDEWWINHHVTSTKPDGTFELYSEYRFYHWMVSSTLHEMIRKDINPDTAYTGKDGIPTIRLGTIELKRLNIPALFE